MSDPRTSTALRQLSDLGQDPDPPRWAWAIARLDPKGRMVLPAEARLALGGPLDGGIEVRGICHRVALVVAADGAGAAMVVDSRGRLSVPVALRSAYFGPLVVGTQTNGGLVVIARSTVLDGVGDLLAGRSR